MQHEPKDTAQPTTSAESDGEPSGRRVNSQDLLGESNEVVIVHGSQEYRLRRTRQGKLILIK